ncbi:MAG: bifunctional hydroxymethylpyrimidine kinase/phosphomethylpyrimidine kinase [Halobacteriota archaeon]|nr:bifunctional hydroxymethylpyrimidine kinase/phosphomethylpyrimidine kinase [Halobacteriota archaeon]
MSGEKKITLVMTIAGSDPCGGAGIEADLKTFASIGVHGACAITSVTAQNSRGVQLIHDLPVGVIDMQIDSILFEMDVNYAKSGMLHSPDIVRAVAKKVKEYDIPLVVDPVMTAESGGDLLQEEAIEILIHELIPVTKVVTPNIHEAEKLSGICIKDHETAKEAAEEIYKLGADAVIITGGHPIDPQVERFDLIFDGETELIKGNFLDIKAHGTGCTYSAALCARLARGDGLHDAAISAKKFVYDSIYNATNIGSWMIMNHTARLIESSDRYQVLEDVNKAVAIIDASQNFYRLIPEVGCNIGMGIHGAAKRSDIAAVNGRIHSVNDKAKAFGSVDFGASDHVSRIILTAMDFDEDKRAAMNIRYSRDILSACSELGMSTASFDRRDEPEDVKTMDWGVSDAIKRSKMVPDTIYDEGDIGKEPMIRILGNSAVEVVSMAMKILKVP